MNVKNRKDKFSTFIIISSPFWIFSVLYFFSSINTTYTKTVFFIFFISNILFCILLLILANKYITMKVFNVTVKIIIYLYTLLVSSLLILIFSYSFINPVKTTVYKSPDGKNKLIVLTRYVFDQIYDIEAKPAVNDFIYKNNNNSKISIRYEGKDTPPVCIKWLNNKTALIGTCSSPNPEYDAEITINF